MASIDQITGEFAALTSQITHSKSKGKTPFTLQAVSSTVTHICGNVPVLGTTSVCDLTSQWRTIHYLARLAEVLKHFIFPPLISVL